MGYSRIVVNLNFVLTMTYLKARWDEHRADVHSAWGGSWWFFEFDDDGAINRQVEVYDSGVRLRYDREHLCDEFGGLGEGLLQDMDIPEAEVLSVEQFEVVWESAKFNGAVC